MLLQEALQLLLGLLCSKPGLLLLLLVPLGLVGVESLLLLTQLGQGTGHRTEGQGWHSQLPRGEKEQAADI